MKQRRGKRSGGREGGSEIRKETVEVRKHQGAKRRKRESERRGGGGGGGVEGGRLVPFFQTRRSATVQRLQTDITRESTT